MIGRWTNKVEAQGNLQKPICTKHLDTKVQTSNTDTLSHNSLKRPSKHAYDYCKKL